MTSILDKIRKSGSTNHKTSILLYSKPKLGKTTLCVNIPNSLVIEPVTENGTSNYATDADVFQITCWTEFQDIHDFLEANPTKYEWVAVDGLTSFLDLAVERAKEVTPQKNDTDIPWGTTISLFKTMFNQFQALPVNTLYTAHEKEKAKTVVSQGDLPGVYDEPRVIVDLPGQLGGYIAKNVDLTARLYVEYVSSDAARAAVQLGEPLPSGKRYIRIGASSHTDTGHRSQHDLPDVFLFKRTLTIPKLHYFLENGIPERPQALDGVVDKEVGA